LDPPGFVVEVTVGAAVVDVGAVVDVVGAVVAVVGAVVDVVGPASSAVIRFVMTEAGGFGMVTSVGTKAIVISWPFWNRRF
jgi:hypothetical protein